MSFLRYCIFLQEYYTLKHMENTENHEHNAHHDAQQHARHTVNKLEAWMADIFKNAPHLPEGGRKWLVDVAPYISLIFGILGVIALVTAGGASLIALVLTFGASIGLTLHILISLVSAILLLMAYKGLKSRSKSGWNFAFWSELVSVLGVLVGIVTMYGMNIGGLIGCLIGFYILFEVREHYK